MQCSKRHSCSDLGNMDSHHRDRPPEDPMNSLSTIGVATRTCNSALPAILPACTSSNSNNIPRIIISHQGRALVSKVCWHRAAGHSWRIKLLKDLVRSEESPAKTWPTVPAPTIQGHFPLITGSKMLQTGTRP